MQGVSIRTTRPTHSVGIISDTTTGIEPVYSQTYKRNIDWDALAHWHKIDQHDMSPGRGVNIQMDDEEHKRLIEELLKLGQDGKTSVCGACGATKPVNEDYLCGECRDAHDLADSL